jgi:hypothetical protein
MTTRLKRGALSPCGTKKFWGYLAGVEGWLPLEKFHRKHQQDLEKRKLASACLELHRERVNAERAEREARWLANMDPVKWMPHKSEQVLVVHHPKKCKGQFCAVHNPSNHHMRDWQQHYRLDRGITERLCPKHGVGHPDPDDPNPDKVHGCCGCCTPPKKKAAAKKKTPAKKSPAKKK